MDHAKDVTFNKNFFNDWLKVLKKQPPVGRLLISHHHHVQHSHASKILSHHGSSQHYPRLCVISNPVTTQCRLKPLCSPTGIIHQILLTLHFPTCPRSPAQGKGSASPLHTTSPPSKGNLSAQVKGPSHVIPPTFTSTATSKARPSLVMELEAIPLDKQNVQGITGYINSKLSNSELVNV